MVKTRNTIKLYSTVTSLFSKTFYYKQMYQCTIMILGFFGEYYHEYNHTGFILGNDKVIIPQHFQTFLLQAWLFKSTYILDKV